MEKGNKKKLGGKGLVLDGKKFFCFMKKIVEQEKNEKGNPNVEKEALKAKRPKDLGISKEVRRRILEEIRKADEKAEAENRD